MQINVNGQTRTISQDLSLKALLKELKLDPNLIAVEKNGEIISHDLYSKVVLNNNDQLELIRFMGGG
ncbi:MAG: sulfur carrier protein ThiS [Candidatus Margulisiibacteriota bacterium]|jgi:sulfur carrier protein